MAVTALESKPEVYGVAEDADNVLGPVNLNQHDPVTGLMDEAKSFRDENGVMKFPGRSEFRHEEVISTYDPSKERRSENPWMEKWWGQALSGIGKGVVRGVGLEVHPSLGKDTPLEAAVSGVTQVLHPGLSLPNAAISTTQMASGQKPITFENVAEAGKDAFLHYGGMSPGRIGAAADGVGYVDQSKDAVNVVF